MSMETDSKQNFKKMEQWKLFCLVVWGFVFKAESPSTLYKQRVPARPHILVTLTPLFSLPSPAGHRADYMTTR